MSESKEYNEYLLVSELKCGNEKAFKSLFDHYYQAIYGYSISLLKSKDLAEENVQDVFMKIWMHREQLNAEQSFKAFLYAIARNAAFNTLSKAANDSVLREEIFYNSDKFYEKGDFSIREADCKKIKKAAIKQLPPMRKKIFKLSRKQGKTYEEISQELGISLQTVKNQMSKALESLRNYLRIHDEFT